jgi:hypothetical protein
MLSDRNLLLIMIKFTQLSTMVNKTIKFNDI